MLSIHIALATSLLVPPVSWNPKKQRQMVSFVGEIGLHGTQAAFHMGPVWEYFLGMDPITLVPNLS